jgi:uncharacterized protein YndB with AHSA1/START domain
MTTMSETKTTQMYRVFIKASPEAIWDAITNPEWSVRYGYGARNEYELQPGGSYIGRSSPELRAVGMPEVVVDGEVIEADPPRRLVHTWRGVGAPGAPTTVACDLLEIAGGTRVRLRHWGFASREACAGFGLGWQTSLERLAEVLAADPRPGS